MKQPLVIALVLIGLFGSFGNYLRFVEHEPDRPPMFDQIPLITKEFVGEEQRFDKESYEILKADTTTLRLYVDQADNKYWLFVAYFASQKYGSQTHSPRHCLPGGGWRIQYIEPYELVLPNQPTKLVNRLSIGVKERKQLMLYWFETRSGAIRDEFGLKFDLMKNSLLLRPTDAAIVRLTVPVGTTEDFDTATARALEYLKTFGQPVTRSLPFGSL